jgi:hypothetical protein
MEQGHLTCARLGSGSTAVCTPPCSFFHPVPVIDVLREAQLEKMHMERVPYTARTTWTCTGLPGSVVIRPTHMRRQSVITVRLKVYVA